MDLIGLDADLQPVKTLVCVNIQWNRRYFEAGDFQLQLRAADYDMRIAYIYTGARPETGMVEKVETEHTLKGDFVLVSGFFLEGMLNWKAIYPRFVSAGNITFACYYLVKTQMEDAAVTVPVYTTFSGDANLEFKGDLLGDSTYKLLKALGLSQRIRLDYVTGTLIYEIWQGLNRSQSQSVNPYAVFSQGFGTVDTLTFTQDTSGYRNYAIAVYDDGVVYVDVRTDTAQPKRVLYLDTGMSAADDQTQEDFLASVKTAAQTELNERGVITNIDADVLQNNIQYLDDYDLGDRCDVRDDRLCLSFETRIIEVNEVWKENTHTVTLQFGDKIPKKYRAV